MYKRLSMVNVALLAAIITLTGCRSAGEEEAVRLCSQADRLDKTDQRAALVLRRKIWEELPTTGTSGASECGRKVRERMGRVRTLVAHDTLGDRETVKGCAWAVDAFEVFKGATRLPFRERWARRLMERCVAVVGRAWTRDVDSKHLRSLNERLKKLSVEPK